MATGYKNKEGTDLGDIFYCSYTNEGALGYKVQGGTDIGNVFVKGSLGYEVGYKNQEGTDIGYLRGMISSPPNVTQAGLVLREKNRASSQISQIMTLTVKTDQPADKIKIQIRANIGAHFKDDDTAAGAVWGYQWTWTTYQSSRRRPQAWLILEGEFDMGGATEYVQDFGVVFTPDDWYHFACNVYCDVVLTNALGESTGTSNIIYHDDDSWRADNA